MSIAPAPLSSSSPAWLLSQLIASIKEAKTNGQCGSKVLISRYAHLVVLLILTHLARQFCRCTRSDGDRSPVHAILHPDHEWQVGSKDRYALTANVRDEAASHLCDHVQTLNRCAARPVVRKAQCISLPAGRPWRRSSIRSLSNLQSST
jgi:hypothetical protein